VSVEEVVRSVPEVVVEGVGTPDVVLSTPKSGPCSVRLVQDTLVDKSLKYLKELADKNERGYE